MSELDAAILATIAIGVLDGPHKRERLAKSVERLTLAARAEGYAAGAMAERDHTVRACSERAVQRARAEHAEAALAVAAALPPDAER